MAERRGTRKGVDSLMHRNQMLKKVRERTTPWDMLVIGGGASGIGVAVDAASRGFDVLLLEAQDFGKERRAAARSWCTAACAIWSRATSHW